MNHASNDGYTLTVWRFVGETAIPQSTVNLRIPRGDAIEALKIMRQGLPDGFGAGLTDAKGRNIS